MSLPTSRQRYALVPSQHHKKKKKTNGERKKKKKEKKMCTYDLNK